MWGYVNINDVVANQRAQVISNSWGNPGEAGIAASTIRAYERIFKAAADVNAII